MTDSLVSSSDPAIGYEKGVRFRDLNGNGSMDPYEDPRLPVAERVEDLLERMTLEEKAGLLFHTMMQPVASGLYEPNADNQDDPPQVLSTSHLILDQHINHFNATPTIAPREYAAWQNRLQRLAATTRLGIPVTLSSDPVHGFVDNPATSVTTQTFSRWPEPLGFAAAADPDLVSEFADIVRQEYLAVGVRVALHPQADLGTEPRWSRISGTFGADADLASSLVGAYVRAMQTEHLGPQSVACMTKHFPGAGPQLRGDDAHFPYGREQVYPGANAEYHLKSFEAAFAAGTAQVMPYYAIPVGVGLEEVGFAFNKEVITGWLRGRYGFTGVICSDWGLVTDVKVNGWRWPARCWGMEHASRLERVERIIDAGVDQLGGEFCPELVIQLAGSGRVTGARIDASARRILADKFRLGLFDDPYVDEQAAERTVGRAEFRHAGHRAQQRALTLLKNEPPEGSAFAVTGAAILPLPRGLRLYLDGITPEAVDGYGTVVTSRSDADVALVRVEAPYEHRESGIDYENAFHQGRLDFPPAAIERITADLSEVPSVLVVRMDRPAIIPELARAASAVVAEFGATDRALLEVLFGDASPHGRLPIELPSSMDSVEASQEDVPNDSGDPTYPAGHGLSY